MFQIIVISGLSCEDYKLCSKYGDDQEFKVLDWITLNVGHSLGFTLYLLVWAQIWTELLSFYRNETLRRITDIAAWNISTCFMDEINKIPTENQQPARDPGNSTLSLPAGWWDYISKYHTRPLRLSDLSQCFCQLLFASSDQCPVVRPSVSQLQRDRITSSNNYNVSYWVPVLGVLSCVCYHVGEKRRVVI